MHPAIIIGIVRALIVDVAMGQIPRSTERISSFRCNHCLRHVATFFDELPAVLFVNARHLWLSSHYR